MGIVLGRQTVLLNKQMNEDRMCASCADRRVIKLLLNPKV